MWVRTKDSETASSYSAGFLQGGSWRWPIGSETTSSGSRLLHVLSWARVRTTDIRNRQLWGKRPCLSNLAFQNKFLIHSGGLIFDPVMPRERWMTLLVCPRAVSLVFMSLPGSEIFRSSLPTPFIWSLYNQNQKGPLGSHSWNSSPGTNSWNPSSVGGKLPDFCKILPPG